MTDLGQMIWPGSISAFDLAMNVEATAGARVMTDVQKTPKHLWIIGIIGLIWNLMAAFDYLMAKFQVAAYTEMWSAAEQAYFTSFPLWVNATWAVAVWGAVLGSVLLLMRNEWAVAAFAISLLAMLLNTLYSFVLADLRIQDVAGPGALAFTSVIVIFALLLLHYARRMRDAGVLR